MKPRTTLRDIATEAEVSVNTVSLALRNSPRISEQTRRRIHRIATRLNYRHNPLVSQVFSDIRKRSKATYDQTIAILNAHIERDIFRTRPTFREMYEGCLQRAEASSCKADVFWIQDPNINARQLNRMLRTRSIEGVIVIGMMHDFDCFRDFKSVWERSVSISAGILTSSRGMHCSLIDHFELISLAHLQSQKLGYKRPGLYLAPSIDKLLAGRLSGSFALAQQSIASRNRIEPLRCKPNKKRFLQWIENEQPDVIFTFYEETRSWLEEAKISCPDDLGIILLGERPGCESWTYLTHNGQRVGASSIDLLLSNLRHREIGLSEDPQCVLHLPDWSAGNSTRQMK